MKIEVLSERGVEWMQICDGYWCAAYKGQWLSVRPSKTFSFGYEPRVNGQAPWQSPSASAARRTAVALEEHLIGKMSPKPPAQPAAESDAASDGG